MGNRKPVILGLDVSSSSTGYAVLRNGRWNKSKASFGIIKTSSKDPLAQRLLSFRDQLEALLKKIKPTHVVIEDVFSGRNISTTKLLSRFSGVALEICLRRTKKEPLVITTMQVRSFLGCGKKKENAFAYICDRYNLDWDFKKMNDVADALALALYMNAELKE